MIESVVAERSLNEIKLRRVTLAFLLLVVGVVLVCPRRDYTHDMDGDRMNGTGEPMHAPLDLDESPFELGEIEGIPFAKDSIEARAIRRVLDQYEAARGKVGPSEFAYTDDSPFALPPRD